MTKKTVEDYRNEYREMVKEAGRRFGWDAATLKDKASALATYYQGKGESLGQSWASAAREIIDVESESRNS